MSMEFTFQFYKELLALLQKEGYAFWRYHDYEGFPPPETRCVILRHDIDFSLEQAVRIAELEAENGIRATYFVLLRTDFYNAASKRGRETLRHIQSLGHEIGLHFDEAAYPFPLEREEVVPCVLKECSILSALLESEVSVVSMHRPSQSTLEADFQIPGVVNSYGKTFFHDFKYLSDSRCRWREPVLKIIRSGEYDRLHILTHPFWYHERSQSLKESMSVFIRSANRERWKQVAENITDIYSIMREEDVL